MFKKIAVAGAFSLSLLTLATAVSADEVTIKAVNAWREGSNIALRYEEWLDVLNERGEGLVDVSYIGGAPAIGSPTQLMKKVQAGVYDMVYITGGWYTNVLPSAETFKLSEVDVTVLRTNGGMEYIQALHEEEGLYYLGRVYDTSPYYLYLNKPIDSADLSGLNIRVSPAYQAFFTALGANTQSAPVPEVYTLMERGVIDGFGWVAQGLFDFSWDQVADYRVDPGFFTGNAHIILNNDTWDGMTEEQQGFMLEMILELEAENYTVADQDELEMAQMLEAGVETISLSPEQAAIWTETARRVGWETAYEVDAEVAAKLEGYLTQQ
ncbi:hypothetical protein A9Q96_17020 [Rhodobacterales bacterium 52_120_T64]|nr:hypothetical protein A9Q96_17020 [Rhodobacterales bacterium 52_120_T64]